MREYFVNADFDLSLRPGRTPRVSDDRGRQAMEMPHHLLLLGVEGDSVLVDAAPDEDFLAYLERAGLPRPRIRTLPNITRDARFVPFGWNREAAAFSRCYQKQRPHPPLEVVQRVNGRRFAAMLEKELFEVEEVVGVFDTESDLEVRISSGGSAGEWLLKSEHGNAGLGNRRIRSCSLGRSDSKVIRRLLSEDVCVLLERWRHRVLDISTVFSVDGDGEAKEVYIYEVVNTADGAYIGSFFEKTSGALEPWRPTLKEIASKVARRLAEEGYFGPVCLDHFVWLHEGDRKLRPLADLNARLQVSAPMLRLWRSWDGDRVFYWRLFNARKLRLPNEYGQLESTLGRDAFDPGRRKGALMTSPFRVAGRKLRRIGILLAAADRAEVEALDRRLRERFER